MNFSKLVRRIGPVGCVGVAAFFFLQPAARLGVRLAHKVNKAALTLSWRMFFFFFLCGPVPCSRSTAVGVVSSVCVFVGVVQQQRPSPRERRAAGRACMRSLLRSRLGLELARL